MFVKMLRAVPQSIRLHIVNELQYGVTPLHWGKLESVKAILALYPESQQLQVIRESIIELLPQTEKSKDTKQLHSSLHSDNRVEQREAKIQRLEVTDSLTEAESVTTVRIAFNLE